MKQVPREPALALHWLAIDGVQPLVPQNPPPQSVPETPAPVGRQRHQSMCTSCPPFFLGNHPSQPQPAGTHITHMQ